MATVTKQVMRVKWKNGVMVVRYVAAMDDGTFDYGEDVDMPANEQVQLANVLESQRRRLGTE